MKHQPPKNASNRETPNGERIAKVLARAGVASRRDAEKLIEAGRIKVNGKVLTTPACKVTPSDKIEFDGKPVGTKSRTRLWRYHKPNGLLTSHKDPQGRPTVFDNIPKELPRVISVGRLDLTSEGLLLLTNNGELARQLELPKTGWSRRYRARAYGRVTQEQLDRLKAGIDIDGIPTGPIEATLSRQKGDNCWIDVTIREGKNREVRRALDTLGLKVNRLIRVSYGPFQLLDLKSGTVEEVKNKTLRDQVGHLVEIEVAGPPQKGQKPNKPTRPERANIGYGGGSRPARGGKKPTAKRAPKGCDVSAKDARSIKSSMAKTKHAQSKNKRPSHRGKKP